MAMKPWIRLHNGSGIYFLTRTELGRRGARRRFGLSFSALVSGIIVFVALELLNGQTQQTGLREVQASKKEAHDPFTELAWPEAVHCTVRNGAFDPAPLTYDCVLDE